MDDLYCFQDEKKGITDIIRIDNIEGDPSE